MNRLKVSLWLVMAGLWVGAVHAEMYEIDAVHSQVGFRIRHLVAKTSGQFDVFAGSVELDEKNLAGLKAEAIIQTASINTSNAKRDGHLKSADFFNVEKFPTMTFKSTGAKVSADGKVQLMGNFTLLGVTKPVTLDVELGGVVADQKGNLHAGFSAKGKINRKEHGMVYNSVMDKGALMLGEEVEILIEVEGVKKK